jgi:hypothetical protein
MRLDIYAIMAWLKAAIINGWVGTAVLNPSSRATPIATGPSRKTKRAPRPDSGYQRDEANDGLEPATIGLGSIREHDHLQPFRPKPWNRFSGRHS